MTTNESLFTPLTMGAFTLPNRIVMAPLTRNRAADGRTPHDLNAEYYGQRAGFGLQISEATIVSPQGAGYIHTPGLYTDDQVEGWKLVTDAVHADGGTIIAQLWHVGRVSHTEFHAGEPPVAPTAANADSQTFTSNGFEGTSDPRPLRTDEIGDLVESFAAATRRAVLAGFDGVEVHGANGYLLEQFLSSAVNTREDAYGGDAINDRARVTLEVVDAVIAAWSAERVGIRLSLGNGTAGAVEEEPAPMLAYLGEQLQARSIAYVHVVEGAPDHAQITALRDGGWTGPVIANGGYDRERGTSAISDGVADAIAYGRLAISNPDLPTRFEKDADLNEWNQDTFYGGGAEGYTDYPALGSSTHEGRQG